MKFDFPDKFDRLHEGQEFIRAKTKDAIKASPTLLHHMNVVEQSMTIVDHFARGYPEQNEEQLIVQHIGLRLFNSMAGAVQSLMAGYYQNSVMQMRDVLEIGFLLDFFRSDKTAIALWNKCDEGERNRQFSAYKVRTTLDERDGFTEQKRKEHYQLLCSLGAHVSPKGFELLRPVAGGDAHCGPYFAGRALDASLSELAKVAVGAAGHFMMFFEPVYLSDGRAKLEFLEAQSEWFREFYGQSLIDRSLPTRAVDGT